MVKTEIVSKKQNESHIKKKYAPLLKDKDVTRWYENKKRGSTSSAEISLRSLGAFCNSLKTTPKKIAKMNGKRIFDTLLDYVTLCEKRGLAGSTIESYTKVVRSWMSFNHNEVKGKIKIRGSRETPSLANQRAPNQEELKRIFLAGDMKARVESALISLSGLRPQSIGNFLGNDGIRIRDLPELKVNNEEHTVEFTIIPTMITVRSSLSKAEHQYFTFLSEEGCEYLKEYLEWRMKKGEKLTDDSPIVTPKLRMKPFIRTTNIGDSIRNAINKSGFNCRPYELRTYFDTQLMIAESNGLMIRDYRAFFMGHKGDIENRYTTNRKNLPPHVIDDIRESYRRSQNYLQTMKVVGEEDLERKFQKTILKAVGFKPEEIDDLHPSDMTDDEFSELVKKKLIDTTLNENRQKVVSVSNVEQHLEQGWEFVTELSNHKAVVRLPN